MVFASFSTVLAAVINVLFLVAGVYIYVSLLRQIAARNSAPSIEPPPLRTFDLAEAVLAAALVTWFLLNVTLSFYFESRRIGMREIVSDLIFRIGLLLFMLGFLRFRRLDLRSLTGVSRIGFWRTLGIGLVLLLAAYPLIYLADAMMQRFGGGGVNSSRQQIVDLFSGSETIGQRMIIIFLAVVIAPISEEFIFRFFLYGVFKRYGGWFVALILSSLLFAAVHMHMPSFAALFALGCCFAVAYEWSGSILVSMTMHALFNATTLTFLAFPEIFTQ